MSTDSIFSDGGTPDDGGAGGGIAGGSGGGSAGGSGGGSSGGSGGGSATVYAAGWGSAAGTGSVPGYWVNGAWVGLTLPPPSAPATGAVNALLFSREHVYAGGYAGGYQAGYLVNYAPGYWLDGSWVALAVLSNNTSNNNQVTSLALAGSDLYAAGFLGTQGDYAAATPGYWKNGSWTALPVPASAEVGEVTSIAVSGSDVYFGGFLQSRNGQTGVVTSLPGYWLNGAWVDLITSGGSLVSSNGQVASIFLDGSNVYAAGYVGTSPTVACYWMNGNLVMLPPAGADTATRGSAVNSIAVTGTGIFAAGYSVVAAPNGSRIPGYWLNGAWTAVTPAANALASAVNSIFFSGSGVYAGGYSGGNGLASGSTASLPGYWLNGTWVGLSMAEGAVNAIAVR